LASRGPTIEYKLDDIIRAADLSQETAHFRSISNQNQSLNANISLDLLDGGAILFQEMSKIHESYDEIKRKKRFLQRELIGLSFLKSHKWKLEELKGRESGDIEWRKNRGEI
jgi:hypothetical protein